MKLFALTASLLLSFAIPGQAQAQAQAQDWPTKPIKMVVSFAAGGAADYVGRLVAQKMTAALGQPVVVENKAGATGMIAVDFVAKSAPDGYTLIVYQPSAFTVLPNLSKVPYTLADIQPLAELSRAPYLYLVSTKHNIRSLDDLTKAARAAPQTISHGTAGQGGLGHLMMEMMNLELGVQFLMIPYKGGSGPALIDLMGGQINFLLAGLSIGLPQVRAGTVRPIATTGPKRLAALPDVPTVTELGYPNLQYEDGYSVGVPSKTPAAIQQKLLSALSTALKDKDVIARLSQQSTEVGRPLSPEELRQQLITDSRKWETIIRRANITVN